MQQKQVSEEHYISFQAQIPHKTYQETFTQYWNEICPSLQEEPAISHGQCKLDSFQFLPQENYDRNHQSSPDAYNLVISHSCGKSPRCTTPCSTWFSCTPACHSPCCVPKPSQHHSSHTSMWKMHKTPQQPCGFSTSLQNLHAMLFGSLPHMATKNVFSTIPLLTFLPLHSS